MRLHQKAYLHRIRSYAALALWIAWATVFWAAISVFIFHSDLALPHIVQIAALGSAAPSLAGGCFGILYVLVVARTISSILAGACAIILNIGYFWWFVAGLYVSPP
jgi:hypothetical protein